MDKRDIIVIGASAGGFETIKRLVSELPQDFNAAIFIVWHMSPDVKGILPEVLNKLKKLPAAHAINREPVKKGRIYIAPPDHHMLLVKGEVYVTRGPKENRFRPAVDPLFRSAALAYGPRVIGIILSGALDDGSAGLWGIKQQGGIAMVQDPEDAEVAAMPENAMKAVEVDYCLSVADMPSVLLRLISEEVPLQHGAEKNDYDRTKMEVTIAMEDEAFQRNIFKYGELTPYTCPECHGVLTALKEGNRIRFRCHTGHAFSADSLLATITESIEDALWNAIRNVQESVLLLNHMGDHFADVNKPKLAAAYFKKAREAEKRAQIVRQAVFDHEQLSADSIAHEAEAASEHSDNEKRA